MAVDPKKVELLEVFGGMQRRIDNRSSEAKLLLAEGVQLIFDALAEFPDRTIDIFWSRYAYGEAQKSVASRHGVTASRIYQIERRTLRQIRAKIYRVTFDGPGDPKRILR